MFTFAVMTYKHERFLVEHLESIKYQILSFGNGNNHTLLISDDNSDDRTVELADKWIEQNRKLFRETKVVKNSSNMGIVNNYLKTAQEIPTEHFKILAGDDIYYKNNIYEVLEDYDVVFTPTIAFDQEIIRDEIYREHRLCLKYSNTTKFRKYLKYENLIAAPGAFIKLDILRDSEFRRFLSRYHWIEDLPMWYYLFFKMRNISYRFETRPYILYRRNVGISSKQNGARYKEYTLERERLFEEFGMKLSMFPKFINPYKYYWKLLNYIVKHFDSKTNPKLIEFESNIQNELNDSPTYLEFIRHCAKEFHRKSGVLIDFGESC
ncbi:MAG TPA: glycosyltransferase [Saccharofermentans sp.]|nr:glycosyltransferase [Saccharofermentans sp.]